MKTGAMEVVQNTRKLSFPFLFTKKDKVSQFLVFLEAESEEKERIVSSSVVEIII